MNIFVFFPNLRQSAQYFFARDFRRANKQILEIAQCLAAVLHGRGVKVPKKDGSVYSPTHTNHPVVRWLRQDDANMRWASQYLDCLLSEYTSLQKKPHGCFGAAMVIRNAVGDGSLGCPVHHGNNMPRTGDVYADYRTYLGTKQASHIDAV